MRGQLLKSSWACLKSMARKSTTVDHIMIAPLLSWLYMESPNQLPFVPDQVFPTSGCCQLGAARLFTSCCRSSSGGNSTGEAAWNPNKCGEFSHQRCGFHILERQNTIFSGQTALTILFGQRLSKTNLDQLDKHKLLQNAWKSKYTFCKVHSTNWNETKKCRNRLGPAEQTWAVQKSWDDRRKKCTTKALKECSKQITTKDAKPKFEPLPKSKCPPKKNDSKKAPPKSKTNGSKSAPKSECETLATQGVFPFQMAMKIPHPQTPNHHRVLLTF